MLYIISIANSYGTANWKVGINQKYFQKSGKEKLKKRQCKYDTNKYDTHSVYITPIYFIKYNTKNTTQKTQHEKNTKNTTQKNTTWNFFFQFFLSSAFRLVLSFVDWDSLLLS